MMTRLKSLRPARSHRKGECGAARGSRCARDGMRSPYGLSRFNRSSSALPRLPGERGAGRIQYQLAALPIQAQRIWPEALKPFYRPWRGEEERLASECVRRSQRSRMTGGASPGESRPELLASRCLFVPPGCETTIASSHTRYSRRRHEEGGISALCLGLVGRFKLCRVASGTGAAEQNF
jgi:hypothetical protein